MKFLAVCMFALAATSMVSEAKKEKRGAFGLGAPMAFDAGYGYSSYAAGYQSPLYQAAPAYANAVPVAHYQPAAHPVVPVQHTHSVQRITENYPIHAHRTIVKTVPVDRPIPQPFPVVRHVSLPYPVPVEHKVVKEVQVPKPYPVVQEHVKYVPVQRFVPQPYPVERHVPVYVQEQPQHVAVAHPIALPEHQISHEPLATSYGAPQYNAGLAHAEHISHAPLATSYGVPQYNAGLAYPEHVSHEPLATSYGVPQYNAGLAHASLPLESYHQEPVQALESYHHSPAAYESVPQPQW